MNNTHLLEQHNGTRIEIFRDVFPDYKENRIFDYGGGPGGLFENHDIDPSKYTVLDLDSNALKQLNQRRPEVKTHYYDRYNWMYNHAGKKEFNFPDVDKNQDYIYAHSVFSHTDLKETKKTIEWFLSFNFKKIMFSFLDGNNRRHVDHFKSKNAGKTKVPWPTKTKTVWYSYDYDMIVEDKEEAPYKDVKYFRAFYDPKYLVHELKKVTPKVNYYQPYRGVPYIVILP